MPFYLRKVCTIIDRLTKEMIKFGIIIEKEGTIEMNREKQTINRKIHTYGTVARYANSVYICLTILAIAIVLISGAPKNSNIAIICGIVIFVDGLFIFGLTIGLIDSWGDAKDDERNMILEKLEEISDKLEP